MNTYYFYNLKLIYFGINWKKKKNVINELNFTTH